MVTIIIINVLHYFMSVRERKSNVKQEDKVALQLDIILNEK